MHIKWAKVLTPSSFRHLLHVIEATSRFPERDAWILLLGITCGLRVTKIARLQVHRTLVPSGKRREEISLPGSISKGWRPRSVYLPHPRAIEAFERYVSWRLNRKACTNVVAREYRGLMPKTRLIFTQKAAAFELSLKHRTDSDGNIAEY